MLDVKGMSDAVEDARNRRLGIPVLNAAAA
jgi:hypothetical protein